MNLPRGKPIDIFMCKFVPINRDEFEKGTVASYGELNPLLIKIIILTYMGMVW
jgi:hypothetical protein